MYYTDTRRQNSADQCEEQTGQARSVDEADIDPAAGLWLNTHIQRFYFIPPKQLQSLDARQKATSAPRICFLCEHRCAWVGAVFKYGPLILQPAQRDRAAQNISPSPSSSLCFQRLHKFKHFIIKEIEIKPWNNHRVPSHHGGSRPSMLGRPLATTLAQWVILFII